VVPITVRQLEAVVRIAESLARMQLQPVATEAHVRRALDLFTVSTMDAVKSGVMETVVRCCAPHPSCLCCIPRKHIMVALHSLAGSVPELRMLSSDLIFMGKY
jgi:hypothetical protein